MNPPLQKRNQTAPALSAASLRRLMMVAAGRRPADVVLQNLQLVSVHRPEVLQGVHLVLAEGRVAAVAASPDFAVGPKTQVIDAEGRFCLPGMIDAHTHLDSIFSVREFARLALVSGHTSAVTEAAMIAGAAGEEGVNAFIDEAGHTPMRFFFLAPPLVPPFPHLETSAGLDFKAFARILRRPDVVGVGETYWRPALDFPKEILKRFALARQLNKTLEGHAAGAHGPNLWAYRAGGIKSCHEATSAQEALDRLRLGMAVQLREGYIRSELPAMANLAELKDLDTRRLILATDLASPRMLLKTGVMTELVRRAAAIGFDPLRAIQMVTLNPADHFHLTDLGRLDPGARADLMLVDDPARLNVHLVMVGGRVVAREGLLTVDIPDHRYPEALYRSIRLKGVSAADFALKAPSGPVRIRAVAVASETITREEIVDAVSIRGRVLADPERDMALIAVFNRHESEPTGALGMARGLGLRSGAVAASLLWDTNNILAAGMSPAEMALAVNRLIDLGGGLVVVRGKRVLAEMPMPVAGIISEKPIADLVKEAGQVEQALAGLGCGLTRPFLTLQNFCFTGLPFLRLTDKGLVDVRAGRLVPVIL